MSDRPDDTSGIEQLGTPKEVRDARPALYPEHEALDAQAQVHPEVRADAGPDDSVRQPRRRGLAGAWDSLAYGVQWLLLSVFGTGEQSRRADPIEKLRRRYGRPEREH